MADEEKIFLFFVLKFDSFDLNTTHGSNLITSTFAIVDLQVLSIGDYHISTISTSQHQIDCGNSL